MSKLISVLLTDLQNSRTAVKCCFTNIGCNVNWTLSGAFTSLRKRFDCPHSTLVESQCIPSNRDTAKGQPSASFGFDILINHFSEFDVPVRGLLQSGLQNVCQIQKPVATRIVQQHKYRTTRGSKQVNSNNIYIDNREYSISNSLETISLQNKINTGNLGLRTGMLWNKVETGPFISAKDFQSTQQRMFSSSSYIGWTGITPPRSCVRCSVMHPTRCLPDKPQASIYQKRGMAGHSKWQNIKHVKGTKDVQRGMLFSKLAMKLKIAVREGGGDDPKFNNQLARVIAEARSKDMPNTSVEAAIKSAGNKDGGSLVIVEMRGPGSCLWVLETFTDKLKKTKAELAGLIKKHGCSLAEGNSALGAFDKKGVLEVALEEPDQPINMDHFLDVAIEAGAEDVQQRTDEDEDFSFLAFITDPDDLHKVKKALEGRQLSVKNYYFDYTARVPAVIGEADFKNLQTLADKIHGHPDVHRVFDNIQIEES